MKGIILKEINQAVSYEDFETPTPWRNEVLVEIKASALNHRDVWITKGMYPGIVTPIILGSDGVGYCRWRRGDHQPFFKLGRQS
jgi:zinc-binding alcohol dehydrogenase/oxidoreductase